MGGSLCFCLVFFVFVCLSVGYLFIVPFKWSLFSELKNMRGDAD